MMRAVAQAGCIGASLIIATRTGPGARRHGWATNRRRGRQRRTSRRTSADDRRYAVVQVARAWWPLAGARGPVRVFG